MAFFTSGHVIMSNSTFGVRPPAAPGGNGLRGGGRHDTMRHVEGLSRDGAWMLDVASKRASGIWVWIIALLQFSPFAC